MHDEFHDEFYHTDNGETEWRRFPLDLKKLKLSYDPYNLTWNVTRISAFKNALKYFIKLRIPDSETDVSDVRQADGSYELLVSVISPSLGKLSTQFEAGIVMDKECPHNLPQMIAHEFKHELESGN